MKFTKTKLDGVVIIEPDVFGDHRGFFMESWSQKKMEEAGLYYDFVQDNHSMSSVKGTLRGIHFQKGDKAQAKLVRCVRGAVLDVEDFLVSNLFLPLGSLVYLLFCVTRYGWGWQNYKKEVNTGEGLKVQDWMRGYLTYVLPLIVVFIFAFGLYDKFLA